jgi:uncharacterized protein (TIGR02284 family)
MNEDVIEVLNDLIETCKDGEYGFRTSAEYVKEPQLRTLFAQRADECALSARELQAHVSGLGGEPQTGGTTLGALHRGWVAVRGTLAGYSDLAMLEECERGEDAALDRYRRALASFVLPESLLPGLRRQMAGVQRNHDQIKQWRDRLRESR